MVELFSPASEGHKHAQSLRKEFAPARKNAKTCWESFDLVEQEARGLFAGKAHGQGLGECADLEMGIRPLRSA